MTIVMLILGLLLLLGGGELLVRGAVRLAAGIGISPLVIGLTVVGFGTSTPEMVTSVQAALAGTPGIAIGNIVGSNIGNILLILGVAALIFPIAVNSAALRRDGAVLLAVALIFTLMSFMPLGRIVGVTFIAALVLYVAFVIRSERQDANGDHGAVYDKAKALEGADPALAVAAPNAQGSSISSVFYCVTGLALLVGGGTLLVNAAVALAQEVGISDTIIGLTIVAIGTSLPELITSVIAAFRRQADVAFGNIVGSNIYNILAIGGLTAVISPLSVPDQIANFDNYAMILASLLMVIFAWTGLRIGRREGAALLAGYAAYVYLIWP